MASDPITYKVGGMTCGGCAKSVEAAIHAVAPEAVVTVDLTTGRVAVSGAPEADIATAVDEAGFTFEGRV